MDYMQIIDKYGSDILQHPNFLSEQKYRHHKYTTTYQHSIHVAMISLEIVDRYHIVNISLEDLVRGALLHDYYLYNWHNRAERWHKPHAYKHPKIAAENAVRDFSINGKVYDEISKHMWPLTLGIPKYKESWIVTMSDKIATYRERFRKEHP